MIYYYKDIIKHIFCLKLEISENMPIKGLYLLGKLYKCHLVVLDYFPDLDCIALEARDKATSILKSNRFFYVYASIF